MEGDERGGEGWRGTKGEGRDGERRKGWVGTERRKGEERDGGGRRGM